MDEGMEGGGERMDINRHILIWLYEEDTQHFKGESGVGGSHSSDLFHLFWFWFPRISTE